VLVRLIRVGAVHVYVVQDADRQVLQLHVEKALGEPGQQGLALPVRRLADDDAWREQCDE
jgi:hypothetical protein